MLSLFYDETTCKVKFNDEMGGTHNMREEDKKSRNILVGKRQEKLLF
jgi:hypothetical protein